MAARRDKRARQVRREEKALPSYAGRRYTVLAMLAGAAAALVWRASINRSWKGLSAIRRRGPVPGAGRGAGPSRPDNGSPR